LSNGFLDSRDDSFAFAEYRAIAEPQHGDPAIVKERRSCPIGGSSFLCVVLSAVGFDRQPERRTKEIQNVGADRVLAPEFHADEAAIAQDRLERTLGVRRLSAEKAGVTSRRLIVSRHAASCSISYSTEATLSVQAWLR
jgi:hypothetical protein